MLFCPRSLKALAFLRDSWLRLWCILLPHTCMLPNGLSGWFERRGVQHLRVLSVELSNLGFKFQLYSLTWASNSTSLHIFLCKRRQTFILLWIYVSVEGKKMHGDSESSFLRRSRWFKGKAPFLVNALNAAEKNLGPEVGVRWTQGRRGRRNH